jgi:hypothetical protein
MSALLKAAGALVAAGAAFPQDPPLGIAALDLGAVAVVAVVVVVAITIILALRMILRSSADAEISPTPKGGFRIKFRSCPSRTRRWSRKT